MNNSPLRVAFVIGALRTGGAEGQLLELIRHMDRDRFDPTLIVFRPTNLQRAAGLNVVTLLPVKEGEGPVANAMRAPLLFWRMRGELRRLRPHVFHAFLPESATIVGCPAARAAGVPVVLSSRRSSARLYRRSKLVAAAERMALKYTDFALGNSAAITQEICDLDDYPRVRTRTIYNGVNTERFRPGGCRDLRAQFGWTEEHVVLGCVANFRCCKRHIDFIRAAALLHAHFPNTRFLMAGEDRGLLASLRQEISALGLDGAVQTVCGDCHPEKRLYPAMDVYVCASETEGFSNSLLEAMSSGLPLVATRVGGNPEAMRDGRDGFFVPAHNPAAIAEAAGRLVADPDLRRRVGASGREHVLTNFSIAAMVRAHQDLYSYLVSHGTAASDAD